MWHFALRRLRMWRKPPSKQSKRSRTGPTSAGTAARTKRCPQPAARSSELFSLATRSPMRGGVQKKPGVFFPGKPYVNRGISGQTTAQMLIRFSAGCGPPASGLRWSFWPARTTLPGNTGPTTNAMVEDNFASMADIARQSGIKVILASINPRVRIPVEARCCASGTHSRLEQMA